MSIIAKRYATALTYFLTIICLATSNWVSAKETLRVLTWDGYADNEVVSAFEQRFDATIERTLVTSDDDLWQKINSGSYDVFAVNTAELQRYIDQGLSKPINMANIPNHAQQLPRFQNLQAIPGLVRQNDTYAIPYTYSEMGLIYNRKLVKTAPQSMAAMWDAAYRGRVLAFNTSNHNFSLVGLLLGVPNPFRMTAPQLQQTARELVKLRRNVLTFYATAEEATRLFAKYDIALIFGNYGTQQLKALREAGADIGYVIPREGALAWLDCWAISRNSLKQELAEKWINYTLEKTVSERLSLQHGLANTISASVTDSTQNNPIIWLEPTLNPLTRKTLWDRIISGEAPEAF
ncbi:extracellular solute-binding protein [Methylomonas sp. EbA]|uniref:Extracellular solute-binding protein n=2 Tax=Methylomonas albis TaxID=1854563 RepID=A0ABR9CVP9_9GAMM|nr:extracellular solute-binding protein [Methylomonas albis]